MSQSSVVGQNVMKVLRNYSDTVPRTTSVVKLSKVAPEKLYKITGDKP